MKTPDEIKKGLEYCMSRDCAGAKCPYFNAKSCNTEKTVDTLAYIQQLEADNAQLNRCIENMTDKLNATNDAVPRWISVEDEQKPKHHEEVLCRYVFDGDSECFYAVLTYYSYGDNGYVTGQHFTGEGLHDMRVTHWMPLPEPPKEEHEG